MFGKITAFFKKQSNRKIVSSAAGLFVAVIVAAVSALTWGGKVFGWFSMNKDVNSDGLSLGTKSRNVTVTAYSLNDERTAFSATGKDLNSGEVIDLSLEAPDCSDIILIKISSTENITIKSILFNSPIMPSGTDLETPKTVVSDENGNSVTNYYWLSTQLAAVAKYAGNSAPTLYDAEELFSDVDFSQNVLATGINGTDSTKKPDKFTLFTRTTETTDVSNGTDVYFVIKTVFLNTAERQNVYRNFSGICRRTLYVGY
ncbi:MAG: hypothetical protein J6Z34_01435 [Clostridia bacterium]|nr:hypothetical protein [Clostridia bacterium]